MGLLRKKGCYITKARLFASDPAETLIRWYILPECSPFFPGIHVCGGRPWRTNRGVIIDGPGEITTEPLIWDAGLPPAEPADFRGEPDWFLHGIPDRLKPPGV